MPHDIGERVGRYELRALLGAGGMGLVYRARDLTLGRDVALKFLPDDVTEEKRILRFLQEARLASSLSHPNIATIYEADETGEGRPFIAMELVDGRSLAERMQAGTLSRDEILDIASQVALALEAANERGITHRDIKPQNIMIDRRGAVKVLDFGLAKATRWPFDDEDDHTAPANQVETEPGQVVGTVHYMSPEQALGKGTDPRSDIFSLGVILFEMATGRRPFEGATPTQVINAVLHAEPPPLPPWFSGPFEDLVRGCLAKQREKRPSSAAELHTALRKLRHAEPEELTAVKPAAASGSRKARVVLPAALVVAVLVTAAILWVRDRGSRVPAGSGEAAAAAPTRIESLAVLPFSVSGGADAHGGEALAESLIFRLSKIPELRVISRNSSFRFEYDPGAVRDVAAQLDVGALLLGTISERDGRLFVTAELVSAADERALWGERYERAPEELLRVEESIANSVAIRAGFAPSRLGSSPTSSVEAHKLYLEGRYYWSRHPAPESEKAVERFRAAIDVDPTFALAWVGVADTFGLPAAFGVIDPADGWPTFHAVINRAVALDPDLAEAHNSLGAAAFYETRDLVKAEYHLRRAMELNPNYPDAFMIMSVLELWRGNRDEVARLVAHSSRLDPLADRAHRGSAKQLHSIGRLTEAESLYRRATSLNPAVAQTHEELGDLLEELGRGDEAIASWRRSMEIASAGPEILHRIDVASKDGAPAVRKLVAEARLADFERRRAAGQYISEAELIRQKIRAGDRAGALASIDRAMEERNRNVYLLFNDFPFTTLAGEPVYEAARERLRRQEPLPRVTGLTDQ